MPVQLPVGADVTRHALVAEGVVRRKAHRPVAERLERGVPALSIFGILIAAQKFYVRPNAELVVREIDAKSREIRLWRATVGVDSINGFHLGESPALIRGKALLTEAPRNLSRAHGPESLDVPRKSH